MDIGTSIVVGTAIITAAATFFRLCPGNKPSAGSATKCPVHGTVENSLAEGEERMNTMCEEIVVIRKVVIAIAAHQNIPLGEIKTEMQELIG